MTKTLFVDTVYERTHKLATRLQEDFDSKEYRSDTVYDIKEGRKYYKIVQQSPCGESIHSSVHAFVDKNNGNVYKPASWQKPAQHVRYNLQDDSSYNEILSRAEWAGGYLYLR